MNLGKFPKFIELIVDRAGDGAIQFCVSLGEIEGMVEFLRFL